LADLARADVATKCDLDHLGLVTKLELEITKAELRQEIHSEIRSLMIFMSTLFVALAGIAFAAPHLT
jgi:hypothetical protein